MCVQTSQLGNTITELSILEKYFDKFVKESKKLGFDIIDIAENNIQLGIDQKKEFMSKAAFGISYLKKDPESGPASKFIYYIIKTKNPIDQGELISLSHLPRRTIQNAVEELKSQGLIVERNSLEDARKKVYTPIHSDWL